jgi:hypothetical protein
MVPPSSFSNQELKEKQKGSFDPQQKIRKIPYNIVLAQCFINIIYVFIN